MTTMIQVPTLRVARRCDSCGKQFQSKNAEAARMMSLGRLRVCDRCRRAGARTQFPYREYLKTDWWKTRRERALQLAGHRCQVCNSAQGPNVHHRTYERLGHERDADLLVLCESCHKLFHQNGSLAF